MMVITKIRRLPSGAQNTHFFENQSSEGRSRFALPCPFHYDELSKLSKNLTF